MVGLRYVGCRMTIRPGEVRVHGANNDRIKVVAADDVEVLYDAWWSHLNNGNGGWGYNDLSKKSYNYYRIPGDYADNKTRLIGNEPLTDQEVRVHRPDLPLRLLRQTGWCWVATRYKKPGDLAKAAGKKGIRLDDLVERTVLNAPQIIVSPRGPKGGQKRGVLLKADDGIAFRGLELLWKLHELQAPLVTDPSDGAGLYRLGCRRGFPSYYIHGDKDAAGFVG